MKSLDELINNDDPGWPIVLDWISGATNHVMVLPSSHPQREEALLGTQMTTRSILGAVVYETGGMLVDHGWLRILGSGHPQLPRSFADWNRSVQPGWPYEVPYLLVADDVLGGFFVQDNGALGDPCKIFYLAPDSLEFENLGVGYSDFVYQFCLNGDIDEYYSPHRWSGWQDDIAALKGDQVMLTFPPLWTKPIVRSHALMGRSRDPVHVKEAYEMLLFQMEEMADVPNGSIVVLSAGGDSPEEPDEPPS
ncbi:MAG: DUF2625 family protein [Candidatus Obscuribacterales bacterium]